MKKLFGTLVSFFVLVFFLTSCGPSKPELNIYSFGSMFDPETIEQFEKEHDCIIRFSFYENNESMFAKLKAGATGYDLILPSSYFISILRDTNLIEKIDLKKIPNIDNLNQEILDELKVKKSEYCDPYALGYTFIGYNKTKLPKIEHSWGLFDDKEYKGRMTMLNDRREVIGAALKYLGYSGNTKNETEIDKATNLAINWKKNLAKFEGDQYKQGLNSDEYLVVQGWSLDILQIMEENEKIDFFYPKEGVQIFLDTLAIPKNAPSIDLAHEFINFLFQPEIAAKNLEFVKHLILNTKAYDLLSPKTKQNTGIFIPKDDLKKAELMDDIGQAIKIYNENWEKILEAN